MFIIELIFIIGYVLMTCGVMLRGNFQRELVKARGAAEPTDVDVAVHAELRKVKTTFESLFRDERAKKNALSLFPQLQNLPAAPEGKSTELPGVGRMVIDSVFWPVMLPYNWSVNAAKNIVQNESIDKAERAKTLRMLAVKETDPDLRAAFETGDEDAIGEAIFAKAAKANEAAKREEEIMALTDGSEVEDDIFGDDVLLNLRAPMSLLKEA